MKPLVIWLAVVAVLFGALAFITSALRDTTRVFVVVDSSFEMAAVWADAMAELDEIGSREHTEFALATEKEFLHTWQLELRPGSIDPFAPCTFDGIDAHAEVAEADDLILITTGASCDTGAFTEWEIILLEP